MKKRLILILFLCVFTGLGVFYVFDFFTAEVKVSDDFPVNAALQTDTSNSCMVAVQQPLSRSGKTYPALYRPLSDYAHHHNYSLLCFARQYNEVFYERAGIKIPAGALDSNITVSITALQTEDIAVLPADIANVTGGSSAYRFLPHGTQFKEAASIILPYDTTLIPQGYTAEDIRTFFYDEIKEEWVQLPYDTLDPANLTVLSYTTHFTDMINGIIKVPESPETQGYTPTAMKDVKAADPTVGIVAVESPQATAMGGASIRFPLKVPSGRAGIQPQLSLQYGSSGGNGWLGVGWDLNIPNIGIDVQWGVPRYDAAIETETYTLQGEQLTPLAHRGEVQARTAEKTFNLRVEGSFQKIIRHGNHPNNYYWEVAEKSGTRHFYGASAGGSVNENAILRTPEGNIAHWALCETRDANDNNVKYNYEISSHTGTANGTVVGKQIYLREIVYSGHGSEDGAYRIVFTPRTQARKDIQIAANLGLKQVTAEVPEKIEMFYQNQPIRSYRLEYEEGAFFKTLLKSVAEYDADGNLFYKNEFEYYDEVRVNGQYVPFGEEVTLHLPDDNINGSFLVNLPFFNDRVSALGGSKSWGISGGLYAGIGFGPDVITTINTVGPSYNYSRSESTGLLALVDINGDGLPDKIFKEGKNIYYRPNIAGQGFGAAIKLQGISDFSYTVSNSHNLGIAAYPFGANVSYSHTWNNSKTKVYFADFNGDGLIDIAKNGTVYFNRLENGIPTFSSTSAGSPAPIIGGGSIDPALLPDTQAEQAEMENNYPLHDVLRFWQAPFSGVVNIDAPVFLIEDTGIEAAQDNKKDGVNVKIQLKGNEIWSQRILANDFNTYTPSGLSSINVEKGDRIYFRAQSVFNGAYDKVNWQPKINYISFNDAHLNSETADFYGRTFTGYDAENDFLLCGEQNIRLPYSGTVDIEMPIHKSNTGSGITIKIEERDSLGNNPNIIFKQNYNGAELIRDTVKITNFQAEKFHLLAFSVTSDVQIHWENITVKPKITYTSAGDSNAVIFDENNQPIVKLYTTADYQGFYSLQSAAGSFPVKMYFQTDSATVDSIRGLPQDDTLRAFAGDTVFIHANFTAGNAQTQKLTMLVRGKNNSVYQRKPMQINAKLDYGTIPVSITYNVNDSIMFLPSIDDDIFVEYYFEDELPDEYALQQDFRDVFRNLSTNFYFGDSTHLRHSATAYSKNLYPYLGNNYRGWGQFAYNGNGIRANQPIDENVINSYHFEKPSINMSDIQNQDNLPEMNSVASDIFVPLHPNAEKYCLMGYDMSTYITAKELSASRMGIKDVEVEGYDFNIQAGGLSVLNKESKGDINSLCGGYVLSLSRTSNTTTNNIDMLDLNGDRYPDLLTKNKIVYTGFDANLHTDKSNDFVHTSHSIALGASAGGAVASFPMNTSKQSNTKPQGASEAAKVSISLSGSLSHNDDEMEHTLMDVNADGLPDKVYSDGMVSLNLGYGFAAKEHWDFSSLRKGESYDVGAGLGVSLFNGSFQAGVGLSATFSNSNESLLDVNGDGLPDKVIAYTNNLITRYAIAFNTGNGFAAPVSWENLQKLGEAVSTGESANVSYTFGFMIPIITVKLVFNPNTSVNTGVSYEKCQLMDFDGDGYPDLLSSDKESEIKIRYSNIGKTNLLKSVKRPFGATLSLDYKRTDNSYEQPHSMWALSEVKTFDGFAGDGIDSTLTVFDYENPLYARDERTFYGYGKVITKQYDLGKEGRPVYRKVVQSYDNSSYYTKGNLLEEVLIDAQNGDTLSRTRNFYELRNVKDAARFPALKKTEKTNFEGQNSITSTEIYDYDTLGNITSYFDFAAGNPQDRIECQISYHNNPNIYQKSIPQSLKVFTSEGLKRERETGIDAKGNITQIRQTISAGGAKAVFDFEYDDYGNIKKVIRPANYKGQRMFFEYEYDPVLHTLPVRVRDAFGYESSSSYDYKWATPTQTTDINGNKIRYTYDSRGRTAGITAPRELATGKDYTIKFEYYSPPAEGLGELYSITRHAMEGGSDILTYTFADGLFRPVQVKKTGAIFTGEGQDDKTAMIVSGWNVYDGLGRTVESYQSIVEDLGQEAQINLNRNPIAPTKTTYDSKDRAVSVALPDGANSTTSYFYSPSFGGGWGEVQTDPLGRTAKLYSDVKGRQRAAVQVWNGEDITTVSHYNALGEVVQVVNAKNQTTDYAYDMLGRKLSVKHPDAGFTEFEYDNANNLLKKTTPNLRAISDEMFIKYDYDYNRLTEITYPKNVQNYVQYEYGEAGAEHNRAGRLILVQDASGGQEFFYDELGNVVKEIRSILVDAADMRTYVCGNEYDSWGRILNMTYPDGEKVNYQYNAAGNLRSMSSEKQGQQSVIITQLGYNEDEQKVFKLLGNGNKTTYTYEPERKRLATMYSGKGNVQLFNNNYAYDLVDNVLSIENNSPIPMQGLGGKTSNTYQYDELNRLTSANGYAKTKNFEGTYSLQMQYDHLYNIIFKDSTEYLYEDPEHPNAVSQIGSKKYQYDPNGNPLVIEDSAFYRRMLWDEENRLALLSDNGNGNNYIYDHSGERVIKRQTSLQSVYIDGMPVGMTVNTKNATVYVSSNFVVKNHGFTKHYYAGTERVLSKIGIGEFNNHFSPTNQVITAGNKNYIQRQGQLNQGLNDYYLQLQIPPGNPTQPNALGQPEVTGNPLPTIVGDYTIPRGWPQQPYFNPPGGPPGPPAQWSEPITNDNVTAGYGYLTNGLEERDLYFYHPDHLGSTSIITDRNGIATQFVAYMPFGESFVDEHTSSWESAYKFNGKEIDQETGLYYYGARYYDPATSVWYGVDILAEKYPNVGSFVYCFSNPVRLVDPDGKKIVDASGKEITYSQENGWSSNATHDVIEVGNAMMLTPTGTEVLNTMMGTSYPITMTLNEGFSNENPDRLGLTDITWNKQREITQVDISFYKGAIEEEVDFFEAANQPGAIVTGASEKDKLLIKQKPTFKERLGQVGVHEGEHGTNQNAQSKIVGTAKAEQQAVQKESQAIKEGIKIKYKEE